MTIACHAKTILACCCYSTSMCYLPVFCISIQTHKAGICATCPVAGMQTYLVECYHVACPVQQLRLPCGCVVGQVAVVMLAVGRWPGTMKEHKEKHRCMSVVQGVNTKS